MVINSLCFIGNKITHNIDKSFIKNRNLLIGKAIRKCLFPVERCKCIFDLNSIICIFTMPDIPFVRWRIKNFQKFFCKYNMMMRIWIRGRSRTAATTSKMERFVITVNGWKPSTIITKHSILDVAAVLDTPLWI